MSDAGSTVPGDKTICLPIGDSVDYEPLVKDRKAFRRDLDESIAQPPELFPAEISQGYCLHGFRTSAKLGLVSRRIRLVSHGEAYQLRPEFVMPYRIGETEAVEKGLYLRQFGVPDEANADVMGKDPMYWDRASMALGRPSLVGSSLKDEAAFPPSPVKR